MAGVFSLINVPPDSLQPLLLIECPRLLFPFARRVIVADATRDGGFPPLMIDPIDFVSLYRRRQQQAQAGASGRRRAGGQIRRAGDGAVDLISAALGHPQRRAGRLCDAERRQHLARRFRPCDTGCGRWAREACARRSGRPARCSGSQ